MKKTVTIETNGFWTFGINEFITQCFERHGFIVKRITCTGGCSTYGPNYKSKESFEVECEKEGAT